MTKETRRVLVHADIFLPHFPVPTSIQQLLRWVRSGRFPKAYRFGSQKAKPMWDVHAVVGWFTATFGEAFPDETVAFAEIMAAKKSCTLTSTSKARAPVT